MKNNTSFDKNLSAIKQSVEQNRKLLVEDIKKVTKRDIDILPQNLSQKERTDYVYKVRPQLEAIYKLVCQGFTKAQIAEVLGITTLAFRNMQRELPELKAVVEIGTEDKLDSVEASLYHLAMGFEYTEETVNARTGEVEKLTQFQQPSLGAIKYVLGNKRGEEYADKKQIIKKVELGQDIKDALLAMSITDLKQTLNGNAIVVDAEFTERETEYAEEEED